MSDYWIMHRNRVLGPVTLSGLRSLAQEGRVDGQTPVSLDGRSWMQLAQVAEASHILAVGQPDQGLNKAKSAAEELRQLLKRFESLPLHEILRIAPDAPERTFKEAYLSLAKSYHPARLSKDVHPEVLRATMAVFQCLSTRMAQREKEKAEGLVPGSDERAAEDNTLRKLAVVYPNRRAALAAARAEGPELSLFVPTQESLTRGLAVQLELVLADCAQRFVLPATVSMVRDGSSSNGQPPGVGVTFKGEGKKSAARMLAFCAGRPPELGTASSPRVKTEIDCTVKFGGRSLTGAIRDLSATGAFITLETAVPRGAPIHLRIKSGWFGFGGEDIEAKVIWRGNKLGSMGIGIKFSGDPARVKSIVKRALGQPN